ncbi:3'-5' exonuclease [Brevibacillus centrosporus]|uniref:3'-5' exonuclease n=1 Tax=Brevibacillus centrosporus TaxID=54910 RepID=UPI000F09C772|nr:3'-5' exonuclease [Brevibacillus centrosporus]MEC2132255.1 3'-5' exonuclease [Brevibacillus centrosporus]RNB72403.1 3'-5' exonuclease [Brevibacillus centrosporus]GED33833.1 hypothetical protein BCE02nite_49740 [Brevibacillus centrosporus]
MDLSNITVLDFETSGLDPKNDRIIEIAAIRCHEGKIISQYITLIHFDGELKPKITEITGIQSSDLQNGLSEETAIRILNRFIGSNIIVAHNAAFDLSFLHFALLRHAGRTFSNHFIDTLTICRDRHVYPHSLRNMCQRYGIDMNESHRALKDVEGCWELLVKLNEEEPVKKYINQLGYLSKYGPPLWYPSYATLKSLNIKYA